MKLIKGRRYGFYMQQNPSKNFVTALFTGEKDKDNGNCLFMNNNIIYSIPEEHVLTIDRRK